MTDLHIPDISQHQTTVDLSKVGPAVVLRAHNGYRADASFKTRQSLARRYQTVRLFYGYCVADRDPVTQAHELAAIVGPLQPGEAFVCDYEATHGPDDAARATAYLNALSGRDVLYSGDAFHHDHLTGVHTSGLLFWDAAYRSTEPSTPHFLWQHTDHEIHPGISGPCDCSIFHGTVQQLHDLITPPVPVVKPHAVVQPTPLPVPPAPVQEDDMAYLVKDPTSNAQWCVANDLSSKSPVQTMSDHGALQAAGAKVIVLSAAQLASIPTVKA